jgi:hypothetical protein
MLTWPVYSKHRLSCGAADAALDLHGLCDMDHRSDDGMILP